jgi:hypothetical protein
MGGQSSSAWISAQPAERDEARQSASNPRKSNGHVQFTPLALRLAERILR